MKLFALRRRLHSGARTHIECTNTTSGLARSARQGNLHRFVCECVSVCISMHVTHTHTYYGDKDHSRIARSFTCCCCLSSSSPTPSEKYRAVCRGNCVFHVQARRCQSAPASTTPMCVCKFSFDSGGGGSGVVWRPLPPPPPIRVALAHNRCNRTKS